MLAQKEIMLVALALRKSKPVEGEQDKVRYQQWKDTVKEVCLALELGTRDFDTERFEHAARLN